MSRESILLDRILAREGGYVNRAEDRGGPTNFGITLGTLREFMGNDALTADDVKALLVAVARDIYEKRYLAPFTQIENDDLFDLVVDTAVNNGRGRASLWLQRAAGVVEDGIIGPKTIAKVNANSFEIYFRVCALRIKAYGALISQNHAQAVFAAGWMNRVAEFVSRTVWVSETERVA